MSNDEILKHLDYLDGVMLAQSLVLVAFVRHQPTAVAALKRNLDEALSQLEHLPMAQEKRRGLTNTLDKLLGGSSKTAEKMAE